VRRFATDPGGATAIEYTLVAMLIAMVLIAALTSIGTHLNTVIAAVAPALQ
jgi:pilus assembly protein Flp/PilA